METPTEKKSLVSQLPRLDMRATNKQIAEGMKRVEEVFTQIEGFEKQSESIIIADNSDKVGYEKTKAFLSMVRPVRTSLDKERKEAVSPFNNLVKNVNAAYNSAIDALAEIEAPHKYQKEQYEEELEKIKQEKELSENKRIDDMIEELCKAGLAYDSASGYYRLENLSLSRSVLQRMEQEEFNSILAIANEKMAKIKEGQEAEAAKEKACKERHDMICSNGANFIGDKYSIVLIETQEPYLYSVQSLRNDSVDEFEKALVRVARIKQDNKAFIDAVNEQKRANEEAKNKQEKDIEERRKKQAKEDEDLRLKKDRADSAIVENVQKGLIDLGFKFNYAQKEFTFSNSHGNVSITVEEIVSENGSSNIENAKKLASGFVAEMELVDKKKAADEKEAMDKAKEKEAERKGLAKGDFKIIDNAFFQMDEIISGVNEKKLKMLFLNFDTLKSDIQGAVVRFKKNTEHLR